MNEIFDIIKINVIKKITKSKVQLNGDVWGIKGYLLSILDLTCLDFGLN